MIDDRRTRSDDFTREVSDENERAQAVSAFLRDQDERRKKALKRAARRRRIRRARRIAVARRGSVSPISGWAHLGGSPSSRHRYRRSRMSRTRSASTSTSNLSASRPIAPNAVVYPTYSTRPAHAFGAWSTDDAITVNTRSPGARTESNCSTTRASPRWRSWVKPPRWLKTPIPAVNGEAPVVVRSGPSCAT